MLAQRAPRSGVQRLNRIMLLMIALALVALPWADLQWYAVDPWGELGRIGHGLLLPWWHDGPLLARAILHTIAFALLAIVCAAPVGLMLALGFRWRSIRILCAAVRSVHEIFWGLIFMQLYGISALTGLLAIAVPFAGMFAKVFAEIFEQQSPSPLQALSSRVPGLVRYAYTLIPQSWPALVSYTRYRFECALRSSAILGFIGLPTIGFHLDTAFKQGQYQEAGALLWTFLLLIASIRWWLRPRLLWLYVPVAIGCLPTTTGFAGGGSLWRFISDDIWPRALLNQDWVELGNWLSMMWHSQLWPGLLQTLVLTQLAVVLTGVLTLCLYPLATRTFAGRWGQWPGRFGLLLLRSVPEMMLAYIFLLLLGPSGWPAVLALAWHNAGLIGFLMAAACNGERRGRVDGPRGLLHYFYVEGPRRLPALLALLFYRWEVMLRESAIIGILGVVTLGFYIDSAFEEIRYDRAFLLIVTAALLNMGVDVVSRRLRRRISQVAG